MEILIVKNKSILFILFGFLLELYGFNSIILSPFFQTSFWALGGLLFCYGIYTYNNNFQKENIINQLSKKNKFLNQIYILLLLIFGVIFFYKSYILFYNSPSDPLNSDIVPALEMYVSRLLSGSNPYEPMKMPGWIVMPNYLPMLWEPFVISDFLKIDYRWTPIIVILMISLMIIKFSNKGYPYDLFFMVSLFALLNIILFFNANILKYSIELLPVSYYFLLVFSINKKNILLISFSLALILLSRYSISFFIFPLSIYLACIFSWKEFLRGVIYVLLFIIFIYVIPFYMNDKEALINGFNYYNNVAIGEWSGQGWQEKGDTPAVFMRSVSVTKYIYEFFKPNIQKGINVTSKIHLLLLIAYSLFVSFFIIKIKKNEKMKVFLFLSLKIFLMLFYAFITVPYTYLFILPLFINIPIMYFLLLKKHINYN